ncbi:hypothetical protein KY284_032226 [Solanum tuberosum]|nr:hypothetical protein KY284_032226 [Solanum tuberosum]
MSQLRHLDSAFFYLCSPPKVSGNKYRVLENLQTVHGSRPVCCTKEMFEGIKKVKKLGICGQTNHFYDAPKCLDNLIYLPELEVLRILLYDRYRSNFLHRHPVPCVGSFPPNLNKLTLQGTRLLWSQLTVISKLPKLEVLQFKALQLFGDELEETVWELIEKKGHKNWKATDDSFPCLERVIIKNCRFLQEIPKEFADSMTLKRIELWGCTPSLVNFAKEIQEEQEILGNNILQVTLPISPIDIRKVKSTNCQYIKPKGVPQSEDFARSNVIITSHSLEVCRQMKMRRDTELNVSILEADESRLLFVKNAGDDANFCCKDSHLLPHSGVTKQMMEIPVQERHEISS